MLNFAQLSATLKLRAVMEQTHGRVDETLLGRLQNSARDRNWDKIRSIWEMKEEAKADPELAAAVRRSRPPTSRGALARERARPPVHRRAHRALPARVRLARRVEPRVRVPDLPRAAGAGGRARPQPVRERLRLPDEDRRARRGHRRGRGRDPRGPRGRRARRRCARRSRSTSGWRRSPRTTTSTSTRAPTRTSGSCSSRSARSSWSWAPSTPPTTSCSCATTSCGRSSATRRATTGARPRRGGPRGARAGVHVPAARLGRDGHRDPARVPVPRQLGLPRQVPPRPGPRRPARSPASPGRRASSRASRASSAPRPTSTPSRPATCSCAR